jgi:quercetin dioxygenase-like cupin family protein
MNMEIKRNEATLNRPEGSRVIDAPYVYADIDEFVEQVKDEKAWKKSDRNGITIFKTDGMTIVITTLKDGAVIKDNTVNGFFTVQVIEGKIRMDTPEGDIMMKKRQLITFHPGVPHSIEAKKDSVVLLTSYGIESADITDMVF